MAMVFQDPMTASNPVLRIGSQITEGLRHHLGLDRGTARANAVALLRSVGIPEPERRLRSSTRTSCRAAAPAHHDRGGAGLRPRLLFADEPTTALDVTVQAQILNLLAAQQREREMAMILVTHDLGVVAGRADTIAVMYAGQIVETAPGHAVRQRPHAVHGGAAAVDPPARPAPGQPAPGHTRAPTPTRCARPTAAASPRCPYAQDRCRAEAPPLVEEEPGHAYRCWYPRCPPGSRRPREGAH